MRLVVARRVIGSQAPLRLHYLTCIDRHAGCVERFSYLNEVLGYVEVCSVSRLFFFQSDHLPMAALDVFLIIISWPLTMDGTCQGSMWPVPARCTAWAYIGGHGVKMMYSSAWLWGGTLGMPTEGMLDTLCSGVCPWLGTHVPRSPGPAGQRLEWTLLHCCYREAPVQGRHAEGICGGRADQAARLSVCGVMVFRRSRCRLAT